ncbi:hypothetical protein IEQ34_021426 [Dendrobium chrysotoxum]|uniref:Uncharacterized protein n=1 Tax=Dendrobium chrysotoxum TaxID=161865 RepID=A0AAV7FME0_DENCH|nr:hypothetical protein IEQ34_021426 [Dendrobium chrysotoxum]
MGRQPCCDKIGLKKGPWTTEEDKKLINFILNNGQCCWRAVPKLAGLLRCGKSCRLRWTNYLRPDLKRGLLSESEEKVVIDLHSQLGNRWSKIAANLPGRTDNEIKNHWNTHIKKKLRKMGIDPLTHKPLPSEEQLSHQSQHHQAPSAYSDLSTAVILHCPLDGPEAFCTDEVPLMEPHEIIVPCTPSATPCSSSSRSSSSKTKRTTWSSSSSYSNSSVKAEEIQIPSMEWPESVYLWGTDDFMGWDFISHDGEGKLSSTDLFNQNQEQWKCELF